MAAKRRNVASLEKKRAAKRVGADTTRTSLSKADAVAAHERSKDFLSEGEVEVLRVSARRGRWGTRDDLLIL